MYIYIFVYDEQEKESTRCARMRKKIYPQDHRLSSLRSLVMQKGFLERNFYLTLMLDLECCTFVERHISVNDKQEEYFIV